MCWNWAFTTRLDSLNRVSSFHLGFNFFSSLATRLCSRRNKVCIAPNGGCSLTRRSPKRIADLRCFLITLGRASFWAIIVSQENITQTGCPINMETRSTLIFSFCIRATAKVKPVLKNLDPNLQGATLILIFFKKLDYFLGLAKNETKRKFFLAPSRPQPLFFKMSQDFVFSDSFEFEEKTKFHVRYMDLKKKQKSMYPGTWIWRRNKIPCTWVHESEKTKSLDILKKKVVGAFPFCFVLLRPYKLFNFFEKKSKSRWPLEGLNQSFSEKVFDRDFTSWS